MATTTRHYDIKMSKDERKVLVELCSQALIYREIMARFREATGRGVSKNTISDVRSQLAGKGLDRAERTLEFINDGRCVRCREREATHPGLPVGVKGRVCRSCQQALIDEHCEWKRRTCTYAYAEA